MVDAPNLTGPGEPKNRTAVELHGVSKSFGPTQALDDVRFELKRGTVHALLGGNGSGKSTLVKLLAGVEAADSGTLEVPGGTYDLRSMTPAKSHAAGLRFVHQQTSTFSEMSIAENLALGRGFDTGMGGRIRWRRQRQDADLVLERFGIEAHPDDELGSVNPATQKMVAIARALQDQEDAVDGVLVLDEPTAALPDAEVDILLAALRRYAAEGQTILYVTHRLEEVFDAADSATLLRDGHLVDTVSPRQLTHEGLVELITGKSIERIDRLRGEATGPVALELRGLSGGRLEALDLEVKEGEVVGVSGLIGSGRSSLLKLLFGVLKREAGRVQLDGRSVDLASVSEAMAEGFAYIPEDRTSDAAFAELTVRENLSIATLSQYWRAGVLSRRREEDDADQLISKFLVKAESGEAPLSSLSGGNQQKVILARWMRRKPRVLLLDEPTQGVDVAARVEIYELIHMAVEEGAMALFASSDYDELASVCDRVVVLRKGRLVGELVDDQLSSENIQGLAHAEGEASS